MANRNVTHQRLMAHCILGNHDKRPQLTDLELRGNPLIDNIDDMKSLRRWDDDGGANIVDRQRASQGSSPGVTDD